MINQIFQVFDGPKALNVFLLGVATVNLVNGQLLYEENFDSYNDGDAITQVSQAFDLWPAAGATDSFVSNEASWSWPHSLKIEGQLTGGPMDVVLVAGLEGIQEFSFRLLVPSGASGYYNFQENIVAGVAWAFECFLNSDGTIRFAVDPAADGSGGPEFTTTYNYGSWIEIKHEFDTDSNLMNTLIDGVCVGELPYDGPQIGGLNFYAQGDGLTLPLFYVDDISVTTLDVLPGCFLGPSGCTDFGAINFDPTAEVDDGSCTYFETSCAAIGASEWEAFDLGLYAPTALLHTAGQSVTQEVALHLPASIEETGSGTTYAVADWSGLEVMGMPAGLAFDNMVDLISGGSQTCLTYSGVPTAAGTYEVTLTGELFLSVFGNPVSAGMVETSLVITIEANGNAVFGCTYPHALNFNPLANDDDGSCAFAGCTDPSAQNFEPYASVDDGTCETEPCVASCLGDLNNDGTIGSADLLTLLTTFGGDCE